MKAPFGECTQAFLHLHPDKRLRCKGSGGLRPRTLFQRVTSAPTLGAAPPCPSPAQEPCEAGPETPRPPTLRGSPRLAAPPGGRGAHCGPGSVSTWVVERTRVPGPKSMVGTAVSCRVGTKQAWERTDLPGSLSHSFPAVRTGGGF